MRDPLVKQGNDNKNQVGKWQRVPLEYGINNGPKEGKIFYSKTFRNTAQLSSSVNPVFL